MAKNIKHYISEVDKMLEQNKKFSESTISEQEEISKHQRIANFQKSNQSNIGLNNSSSDKYECEISK